MKRGEKNKIIAIRFSLDDYEILQKIAERNRLSVASYVRMLISKEIDIYKKQEEQEKKNE